MSTSPGPVDLTFTAPIGVTVKDDLWSCVEVPAPPSCSGPARRSRSWRPSTASP